MLLTLQDATVENGSYTWRFPQMKFKMSIQTFDDKPLIEPKDIPKEPEYKETFYNVIFKVYEGTPEETGQLVMIPNWVPNYFDFDYFTIRFINIEQTETILPTKLMIELTEYKPV